MLYDDCTGLCADADAAAYYADLGFGDLTSSACTMSMNCYPDFMDYDTGGANAQYRDDDADAYATAGPTAAPAAAAPTAPDLAPTAAPSGDLPVWLWPLNLLTTCQAAKEHEVNYCYQQNNGGICVTSEAECDVFNGRYNEGTGCGGPGGNGCTCCKNAYFLFPTALPSPAPSASLAPTPEGFLPSPAPSALPTPLPTPVPTASNIVYVEVYSETVVYEKETKKKKHRPWWIVVLIACLACTCCCCWWLLLLLLLARRRREREEVEPRAEEEPIKAVDVESRFGPSVMGVIVDAPPPPRPAPPAAEQPPDFFLCCKVNEDLYAHPGQHAPLEHAPIEDDVDRYLN